jgi:serine/threonine protein kinase
VFAARNLDALRRIVEKLGGALANFAEVGLRHRDIRSGSVVVRQREPIELIVTDFGSARLSDFDLESVAPLEVTRYSAPESIVGAVSAASDWWSLGMIVLEQATAGACFEGVNEKAFLIHVVTRGVELPADLEPELRPLLRGLLSRDPLKRWCWPQVRS